MLATTCGRTDPVCDHMVIDRSSAAVGASSQRQKIYSSEVRPPCSLLSAISGHIQGT
jgi:hypothetical protein